MRRREFIALAGGAAVAWPVAAAAQSAERMRRVGVLMNADTALTHANFDAFIKALGALGWAEGRNLQLDVRWAGKQSAVFEAYAAELVALHPDAILSSTTPALAALRGETSDIPIVFVTVTDPVGQGFVSSLARPGGNITGFSNYDAPMAGKWLGLLKEIAPRVSRAVLLFNPDTAPYAPLLQTSVEAAAPGLGATVTTAPTRSAAEIDAAIAALAGDPGNGLLILPDGFTATYRDRIIALAAQNSLPAIYPYAEFAHAGGLIGYGIVLSDLFRRAAGYIDRILKGAKPADLPVQAPERFELAINLKTAKALGLTVPDSMLHLADEVIE